LIAPTPFYRTTDPAQSKFNWGMKGYQEGPTFNAQAYNQAPGPDTPYGLQQLAKPLTQAQIADLIAGRPIRQQPAAAPATRTEAYNPASMITPNANNVYQLPTITAPVAPTTPVVPVNQDPRYDEVAKKLGANWFNRQQAAAAAGDWETYNLITQQVNAILNPVIDQP
jgi:hypothetical protein